MFRGHLRTLVSLMCALSSMTAPGGRRTRQLPLGRRFRGSRFIAFEAELRGSTASKEVEALHIVA